MPFPSAAPVLDLFAMDQHLLDRRGDRVRGGRYSENGGQSRPGTAYIISQRREIAELRAAGVDVDADIEEAALWLFIRKSVADPYYPQHCRAGLTPVHDDLSPAPQLRLEVETDNQHSISDLLFPNCDLTAAD